MRKIYVLIATFFLSITFYAQTDAISYQAVIIDSNTQQLPGADAESNILPNTIISMRFTILGENGTIDYQETQQPTTDSYGLVNLFIGEGIQTSGQSFSEINWDGQPKDLKVEVDLSAGNQFVSIGSQKLTYVPHANHRNIIATQNLTVDGVTQLNNNLVVEGETILEGITQLNGEIEINGALQVYEEAIFENDITVNGISNLNDELNVSGVTNLDNDLNVTGETNFQNNLNVEGQVALSDDLLVSGNTKLTGTMEVIQTGLFQENLTINGNAKINNLLTVDGNTVLNSTLDVYGETSFYDNLNVSGDIQFENDLTVLGATSLNSTLLVTDATLLNNTLDVTGVSTLNDRLVVAGKTDLSNDLSVLGATNLDGTLIVADATFLNNSLGVTGVTSLNDRLVVAGKTDLSDDLSVLGATNLDGTLIVIDATFLNNSLGVTGVTTLNDRLVVAGKTNLLDDLSVSGATNLDGTLIVADATFLNNSLDVTGVTTLNDQLAVTGKTNLLDDLSVLGATSLDSTLSVTDATSLNNSLDVTGATKLNDQLVVVGKTELSEALSVDGFTFLNNGLTVTNSKATILTGDLSVDGDTSLKGLSLENLSVNGDAEFENKLTVKGVSNFEDRIQLKTENSSHIAVFENTHNGSGDGIEIRLGKTHGAWNGDHYLHMNNSIADILTEPIETVKGWVNGADTISPDDVISMIPAQALTGSLARVSNSVIENINDGLNLPLDIVPRITVFPGYELVLPDVDIGSSGVFGWDWFPGVEWDIPNIDIPSKRIGPYGLPAIPEFNTDGIPELTFPNFNFSDVNNSLNKSNEYITFRDIEGRKTGSIKAQSVDDWKDRTVLDGLYLLNVAVNFIQIDQMQAWMKGFAYISNLTEDFNSLGVEYSSGNGDYAEWLERENPTEYLSAGDIVGVKAGKIKKDLTDAEQVMVVSYKPIVLGNVPAKSDMSKGNTIAFMGQVPVKVMGGVRSGDYIVAHPEISGYAKAINPEDMSIEDYRTAVGRAWSTNKSEGPKLVNTVIGVHDGKWLNILKDFKKKHETTNQRLNNLELELMQIKETLNNTNSTNE